MVRLLSIAVVICIAGILAADDRDFEQGALIRFEGEIGPGLDAYFYRKLNKARSAGADLIILEIDSPGGTVFHSFGIAEHLRDIDWAHTVAFVPREALSGAAVVALGCDEIVMGKNARLGNVGVIISENFMFRHAPEKLRSDVVVRIRTLAEAKRRPAALAEAMVDMDVQVFEVTNVDTGRVWFMSDAELESADDAGLREKGKLVLESREAHFLEVSGERAVELKIADGIAGTRGELRDRFGLGEHLRVYERTGVDTAVFILNTWIVAGLLFIVGLVALYIEFSAPGIGFGGLLAGLCFSLFFWSCFLGGTAGWLEVLLFAAGIVFLAVELFVLPGFGVSGLTGVLLILSSLVMARHEVGIPNSGSEWSDILLSVLLALGSVAAVVIAGLFLAWYYDDVPVLSRLALKPPAADEVAADEVAAVTPHDKSAGTAKTAPADALKVRIGDTGMATTPLRPAGVVRFGREFVDVVTEGSFVDEGCSVEIREISGNRIVVREREENNGGREASSE